MRFEVETQRECTPTNTTTPFKLTPSRLNDAIKTNVNIDYHFSTQFIFMLFYEIYKKSKLRKIYF